MICPKCKMKLLLVMFLWIISICVITPPAYASKNISDINGHWGQATIQKLVDAGVVAGNPDGTFKPDINISRAEFSFMVVKAFKFQQQTGQVFSDTVAHWGKDYIATAAANGIVNGYGNDKFGPDDPITREQMAMMIVKADKSALIKSGVIFVDNSQVSSWAKDGVATAYNDKIISGYNNYFRPLDKATKAEAAVIINAGMAAENKPDPSTINDNDMDDLTALNNDKAPVISFNQNNEIYSINGCYSDMIVVSPEDAILSLYSIKTWMKMNDPKNEFVFVKKSTDENGNSYSLGQVNKGIPVYGRLVTVSTDKAGKIVSLSSGYLPDILTNTTSTATLEDAYLASVNYVGSSVTAVDGSLVIYALPDNTPVLAWNIQVQGINDTNNDVSYAVLVNADSGIPITKYANISQENVLPASDLEPVNPEPIAPLPPKVEVITSTYGYSGKDRPLTCVTLKPLNSQNKAVFLNFAIHGAEDAWMGDAWVLVKIADDLEKYYTENPEQLNGTLLTIVRLANPDGLTEGWTNNGSGRCTVVGGYDLNRIWPAGFSVERSARNNTGNEPLLAPESIALRDLVITKATENGGKLNFLYDFHGWLNTSFGNTDACWQFQQTLGIGYDGHLGGGYFANWAKAYASSTALIEYPWPTEAQQTNYSTNTINALKMIL